MPGMCLPIADGGIGFDYRLGMGLPDMWIKAVKGQDEFWDINKMWGSMCLRRPGEKTVAYVESHDQALVGDQTMIFRLAGANMYTDMNKDCHNPVIDRAIALHKMIRLFTLSGGGEAYLNFMGNEFAQFIEWNYTQGLDWLLLDYEKHRKMQHFVRTLNHFYLDHRCLWENDSDWDGFRWLSCDDRDNSVVAFRRISRKGKELIAVCNFCPVLREDYSLPLPKAGWYKPILNTDDAAFGGFDFQPAPVHAVRRAQGEYAYSGTFRVPPMSVCFYQHVRGNPEK